MAKLLYITAHPLDETTSFSLATGKAFIDSYKEANPNDEVVHVDLFKENIPQIDADVLGAWGKLGAGAAFDTLSAEEQAKVARLGEINAQFINADKYVFVTPMWNFSFPPVMKAYLDANCVAGKTFKYTAEGPVGLLPDKKALHIQARGGFYSEGPAANVELGHRTIGTIMQFFGITDFDGLFVEGHAAAPDKAQEIKANAIARAKDLAKQF
ncbi:FMN-dependent NADH-azoreductase [Paenibacillus pinihumi]|uniref:FMN-dependent NADH-azoreductase n=1 Tax=Paenibacillus pinihumi TaxID=669462 RepID=UPI0003FF3CCF|nr:FMN-dependent NADH-azoreductase [Paenibacillus pinihumi]